MWSDLGNETIDLSSRLTRFIETCENLFRQVYGNDKTISTIANLISFYLFCQNPIKYAVLRSQISSFVLAPIIGFTIDYPLKNNLRVLLGHFEMIQEIIEHLRYEIEMNSSIKKELGLNKNGVLVTPLAALGFQFYVDEIRLDYQIPRIGLYAPPLTKEKWIVFWSEKASFDEKKLLKRLYHSNAKYKWVDLASTYGNKETFYINTFTSITDKLSEFAEYPNYYFEYKTAPLLYTHPPGGYTKEGGIIRPELSEALTQLKVLEDDSIPLYESGYGGAIGGPKPTEKGTDMNENKELNIILYGPPGTGKTYNTVNHALNIIEKKSLDDLGKESRQKLQDRHKEYIQKGRIQFTTFHQSYGYEEFIEGIKPIMTETKEEQKTKDIGYSIESGIFKKFCQKAQEDPDQNYVFIIDEINRGNISKIFGELITLIETSKRIGAEEETYANLPYSNQRFGVPRNVYILGTMNTADRSIALLDTALRRRFRFVEMMPNPQVLKGIQVEGIDLKALLEAINQRIEYLYDREHTIGHAFFTPLIANPNIKVLQQIFTDKIIPLLQEYFYEDYQKIYVVLGDNHKDEAHQFIKKNNQEKDKIFLDLNDDRYDNLSQERFEIQPSAFTKPESYIGIYK